MSYTPPVSVVRGDLELGDATDLTDQGDLTGLTRISDDDLSTSTRIDEATERVTGEDLKRFEQLSPPAGVRAVMGTPPRQRRFLALGTIDEGEPVRILGGYVVTDVLAAGGMGVVYRAEHPSSGETVAIKAMHPSLQNNAAIASRFTAESVATARITHPNVVRVLDYGTDDSGSAYMVLELLDGETLSSKLTRERRLDIGTALDIARQIGLGLAAAHQQGVVHRDIKPDNIFLARDPADPTALTVKLLDFGVAKFKGQSALHTHQGDLLGTPAYMAPEQGLSASESDAPSDIYSVGCILFEMVCGAVPFAGNLVETLVAHQAPERPTARAFDPSIPPALDALIDRLIARDPADRPQSAIDMVSELRAIERALTGRRTDLVVQPAPSMSQRLSRVLVHAFHRVASSLTRLVGRGLRSVRSGRYR